MLPGTAPDPTGHVVLFGGLAGDFVTVYGDTWRL
jgi:hypothetical protein